VDRIPQVEEHYTCIRCRAMFARILAGPPTKQIWMLLNAGQHYRNACINSHEREALNVRRA
jgi:hypothetical protein